MWLSAMTAGCGGCWLWWLLVVVVPIVVNPFSKLGPPLRQVDMKTTFDFEGTSGAGTELDR